jgi:hypothetical protein
MADDVKCVLITSIKIVFTVLDDCKCNSPFDALGSNKYVC